MGFEINVMMSHSGHKMWGRPRQNVDQGEFYPHWTNICRSNSEKSPLIGNFRGMSQGTDRYVNDIFRDAIGRGDELRCEAIQDGADLVGDLFQVTDVQETTALLGFLQYMLRQERFSSCQAAPGIVLCHDHNKWPFVLFTVFEAAVRSYSVGRFQEDQILPMRPAMVMQLRVVGYGSTTSADAWMLCRIEDKEQRLRNREMFRSFISNGVSAWKEMLSGIVVQADCASCGLILGSFGMIGVRPECENERFGTSDRSILDANAFVKVSLFLRLGECNQFVRSVAEEQSFLVAVEKLIGHRVGITECQLKPVSHALP